MGAAQGAVAGARPERAPLHREGLRSRPAPSLPRDIGDPRRESRPEPELPGLDGDGHPLLLRGDVFRGTPPAEEVRGRVPCLPGAGPPVPSAPYIRRERTERSANSRTERGMIPSTSTAAAEAHRAAEKAMCGG